MLRRLRERVRPTLTAREHLLPETPPEPARTGPLGNIYDWRPGIDEGLGRQQDRYQEIRDEDFWDLYHRCKAYSMLPVLGFYNLYQSVRYVVQNRIPGGFVECGSFLGGASIFMYILAKDLGDDRPIHVFDTFTGFPPGQADVRRGAGAVRGPSYVNFRDSVQANFAREARDVSQVNLVEGDVVETLADVDTGPVSLLRLDTDFYESTLAELEILYPRLSPGGVLIIDDYGVYEGARQATDEFFADHPSPPLLNRINDGIWAGTKPPSGLSEAAGAQGVRHP